MVEVSLATAVDKLDAGTERERKEGLDSETFQGQTAYGYDVLRYIQI